jgi:hypothetical protein
MDAWKLNDLEALALIGHPGGLTKKGTRPRFRLTGAEAERFRYLREIDEGLKPLGIAPAKWLRQIRGNAPFNGDTPLTHITRSGVDGAREVIRAILAMGLRQG